MLFFGFVFRNKNNKNFSKMDYNRQVLSISIAQILHCCGYEEISDQVLSILIDIVIHFIENIGREANNLCNLASRVQVNALDVFEALEKKGIDMNALNDYQKHSDSIPFITGKFFFFL